MGKTKVTLDTNILVSALGWEGNPKKVFEAVVAGKADLVISEALIAELSKTLDYPKFQFSQEQKDRFKALILSLATLVKPAEKISAIKEDTDDNRVLECAATGKADYIVSGDNDLLRLKEFRGIRIKNPKEFLEELEKS